MSLQVLRDPVAPGIRDDKRFVRLADLEQLLRALLEHILHPHDMARRHVNHLSMLFRQPGLGPVRPPRRGPDEEDGAAEVARGLLGLAGLQVLDQQGGGDGGALGDADEAVKGALVLDEVVQVFERDAHAPGFGRALEVFGEEEGEQLVVAVLFLARLAPPALFGTGLAVFADVGFVPDVHKGGVPLEELEVRGPVEGFF